MAVLLDYALASLADVKEELNIPSANTTYDNKIIRKINAATESIEKYTGRRFKLTEYTDEEYDATNIDNLILKQRPVVTFTRLQKRDTTLNEDDWTDIDTELYFVDYSAGVIDLNFNAHGRWNRYRVSYTAGYNVIPADLSEACVALASFLVESPVSGGAVKSKEEGQRRIEYYNATSGNQASAYTVFNQIGILHILNSYSNSPVLADK